MIPAFALGKTQELLFIIHRLIRQGLIPSIPLYISGLGKSITEIYQEHQRYLRPQASGLSFELFSVLGLLDDLSVERLLSKPCLIVATNGMMVENTPSARIARWIVQRSGTGSSSAATSTPIPWDTGYSILSPGRPSSSPKKKIP